MAHWKNVIKLAGFNDEDADVRAFAADLGRRLVGAVGPRDRDEDLTEIAEGFSELATEAEADEGDFDDLLSRLYDWGDWDHRLFVQTWS